MRCKVFHNLIGIRLRLAMVAKGIGFWDRQRAMANYSPDMIPIAEGMCGTTVPAQFLAEPVADGAVGALGDGTILQAIIDFLKSPAGQALIQALLALLIGLI